MYTVEGVGTLVPSQDNHLGTGGEASVYKFQRWAVKILKDPAKARANDLAGRLSLLTKVNSPRLATPKHKVYDKAGDLVGYSMPLVQGEMVIRAISGDWRKKNNFSIEHGLHLVESMRLANLEAHQVGAVVVDGNELNYIMNPTTQGAVLIDTDSWKIGSFSPTAIFDSIRDPLVVGADFTQESDWFAWAVVSFQVLVGVHPFAGKLAGYGKMEVLKRMKDGASVFSTGAQLPTNIRSMAHIPSGLLAWYKGVFEEKLRTAPPEVNSTGVVVSAPPVASRTVVSSAKVSHIPLHTFKEEVNGVTSNGYLLSGGSIFDAKKDVFPYVCKVGEPGEGYLRGPNGSVIIAKPGGSSYHCLGNSVLRVDPSTKTVSEVVYYPSGAAVRSTFNLHLASCKFLKDLVYQDNFGVPYFMEPLLKDGFLGAPCKDLEGQTILDGFGLGTGYALILHMTKSGAKLKTWFKREISSWKKLGSVPTDKVTLNVARNDVGVWVEIEDDGELRYGVNGESCHELKDSSITFDMALFRGPSGICYFLGNKVYRLKLV